MKYVSRCFDLSFRLIKTIRCQTVSSVDRALVARQYPGPFRSERQHIIHDRPLQTMHTHHALRFLIRCVTIHPAGKLSISLGGLDQVGYDYYIATHVDGYASQFGILALPMCMFCESSSHENQGVAATEWTRH